ncbi:2-oxoglutarate (2OG) and Fe(II)-dependent oxygenase superfamily protein [Abeliophyllum distichum]|uniref:2-oxoglutarate (2OG) and Fe(II)-dependent oxygenase superfamily protein n=1 Tax=Abeliophyllum distichum TaxID=126358 RepID=A0ABD1QKX5_9LAMI
MAIHNYLWKEFATATADNYDGDTDTDLRATEEMYAKTSIRVISDEPHLIGKQYVLRLSEVLLKTSATYLAMALDASSSSIISTDNQENGINYRKGVKFLIDTAPDMKKLPSEFVLPLLSNPLSVLHAEIPVIDLSGLDGPVQRRVSTIRDISSACADWGFFRIINHGIEMPLIEEMLKAVEEFFNLTLEEKMKYASDDVMSPVRYGTSLNTSMKHNLHWRDYFRHYAHPFQKSFHLWPDNPPLYR